MSLLTRADRAHLRRLCRYFGLEGFLVTEQDTPRHDISIQLVPGRPTVPTIRVGPVWKRRRAADPDDAHLALTHEGLHTQGLNHDGYGHRHGFYAHDRTRDRLPRAVHADVKRGGRRFDPRRFGLDPRRLGRADGRSR